VAEDDRQHWTESITRSETAARLLAQFLALEAREAPVSEQEKVLRQALEEDPLCGMAHGELVDILAEADRRPETERAVEEYGRRMPRVCGAHLAMAWVLVSNRADSEAEGEMRQALRVHRGCPGAAEAAFRLLVPGEKWKELRGILEQAHAERPDVRETTTYL